VKPGAKSRHGGIWKTQSPFMRLRLNIPFRLWRDCGEIYLKTRSLTKSGLSAKYSEILKIQANEYFY
jgi:hypothetical protein